jgi:hypothetical protein
MNFYSEQWYRAIILVVHIELLVIAAPYIFPYFLSLQSKWVVTSRVSQILSPRFRFINANLSFDGGLVARRPRWRSDRFAAIRWVWEDDLHNFFAVFSWGTSQLKFLFLLWNHLLIFIILILIWIQGKCCFRSSGFMIFTCGSGSVKPYHWSADPDSSVELDPALVFNDYQAVLQISCISMYWDPDPTPGDL